jgi:hypothetical protein
MGQTWKSVTAGTLSIVSGAIGILVGLGLMAGRELARRMVFHNGLRVIGLFVLIIGIVAVIGGVYSLVRRVWGFALAGAICALFPIPFFNTILGILAIVFVSLARNEFQSPEPTTEKTPPPTSRSGISP